MVLGLTALVVLLAVLALIAGPGRRRRVVERDPLL